jgi:hypothetical protein
MRPGHRSDFPRPHQARDPLRGLTQDQTRCSFAFRYRRPPYAAAAVLHPAAKEKSPLYLQPSMTGHVSHHQD